MFIVMLSPGGGGMMSMPPRSDMTPPMQMTAGPPLLVQTNIQTPGAPPQYAYLPQGPFPQVS